MCPWITCTRRRFWDDHFKKLNLAPDNIVVISPDEGSIKRSLQHVEHLGGSLAIIDKRRSSATETKQANLIGGPIDGKVALLFDDMISTAGSIAGAASIAREHGASQVYVSATHAVFCGPAVARLQEAPIDGVVVTNSLPIAPDQQISKLSVVSVAPLLGEAIRRIHRNESVSYLFD